MMDDAFSGGGDITVTLSQIAELAGVRPSAVSNWRRRFEDFPRPTASAAGGRDLFSLDAVKAWLVDHRRLVDAKESELLLLTAADLLRSELDTRGTVEVLCAALTFVYARDGATVSADVALRERRSRELRLSSDMFEPLTALRPSIRVRLLQLLEQLDRTSIPSLFDSVLALHPRFVETRTGERLVELLLRLGIGDGTAPARIFDPAAGQGDLLLAAARRVPTDTELVGQELNEAAWRIARQRFRVEAREASLALGDSLLDDQYPGMSADLVLCDPPYSANVRFPGRSLADQRWTFGPPGNGPSGYAWLQHVIHHLTDDGRGYVLLPAGTLARGGRQAKIRAALLQRGAVEAIVALPPRAAEHTAIPLVLWVVRQPTSEAGRGRVLLVDAAGAREGSASGLERTLIERIARALELWRGRCEVDRADRGFAVAVSVLELLSPPANLQPARWVYSGVELDVERRRRELRDALDVAHTAGWRLSASEVDACKPRGDPGAVVWLSVGELVDDGRVEIVRGVHLRPDDYTPNGIRVIRAHDVAPGERSSNAYVDLDTLRHPARLTRKGDIVVSLAGGRLNTLVDHEGDRVVAWPAQALRIHEDWLDPTVTAAFIGSPRNTRVAAATASAHTRLDLRELQLPAMPAKEAAELREVLGRIEENELLAREVIAASHAAREALLDLGGYAAAPPPIATRGERGGR
jgi:type I restriction-modification system DNA methylase subunit